MEFEEVDVTRDERRQEEVKRASGRQTVPQVFVDGQSLGGYEELRQLEADGKLDRLLGLDS